MTYRKFKNAMVEKLRDPEVSQLFLETALAEFSADRDLEAFTLALRYIAEAKGGMTQLAERTGLNRQNLYKALSKNGNPKLNTLGDIMHGLGFSLSVKALDEAR